MGVEHGLLGYIQRVKGCFLTAKGKRLLESTYWVLDESCLSDYGYSLFGPRNAEIRTVVETGYYYQT